MKNPYVKVISWHTALSLVCTIPWIVFGLGGMPFSLLGGLIGNVALGAFLQFCVYENDMKKWTHIQNQDYAEWQEDIDIEYENRKKELNKLRLK